MLSWLASVVGWLIGKEQTLELILTDFHSIADKLRTFVDKTTDKIDVKYAEAQSLLVEVEQHKTDANQAQVVVTNIEKLLGISK